MPGLSGGQVATRIRAVDSRVPIVWVTGVRPTTVDTDQYGVFSAILEKPVSIDQLRTVVLQVTLPLPDGHG